jgi:Protein of unknown function (DUF2490)
MYRNFLFYIAVFISSSALGQYRDAGLWSSVSAEYKLNKKTELSIAPEFRLNENLSQVNSWFSDFGVQYKLPGNLSVQAVYRIGYRSPMLEPELRQRLQFGLGYKVELNDWSLSLASRYQAALRLIADDGDPDFISTWRNKVSVKYAGLKKWELGSAFEVFNSQSEDRTLDLTDWRLTFSTEYKINKRNFISFGYLIQKNLVSRVPELDYVGLLSYKLILKKKKTKEEEVGSEIP